MLPDYMEKQPDISRDMRAILVDWMVEVQVRGPGEGTWPAAEQPPPCLWHVGPQDASRGSCGHPWCRADLLPPQAWDEPAFSPPSPAPVRGVARRDKLLPDTLFCPSAHTLAGEL